MKNKLRKLIAEGKTEGTIQLLLVNTEGTDLHDDVIIQSSAYQDYENRKNGGVSSFDEDKISLAKINNALLLIIEKLEQIEKKLPEKEGTLKAIEHKNNNKNDIWKKVGYVALIIGILAGIAEFSGYSIRDIFAGSKSDSFSVTVLVHGEEGKDQLILKNQGKVILDIGGDRKERPINEQGKAIFLELPGKYENEPALISVAHPQPYFPLDRNKEYKLTPDKVIYLPIELTGLNKIKGLVIDAEPESPLDSVRVSVENVATHTDKFGWFELQIPVEKQSKFVRVSFFKEGYKMERLDSIAPHTNQQIQIALQKK